MSGIFPSEKFEFSRKVFLILLAGDFLFLLLHLAARPLGLLPESVFLLYQENSLPEFYQYVKALAVAWLMIRSYKTDKEKLWLAWALVFLYICLDDSLQLHERMGSWIEMKASAPDYFGIKTSILGEGFAFLLFGAVLMPLAAYFHWQSKSPKRSYSFWMFVMVFLLVFFGIFVDLAHAGARSRFWYEFFGILEDGGEMIILSMAVAISWSLSDKPSPTQVQPKAERHSNQI